jgi:membrane-associated phospholipid phosphatase
MRPKFVALAIGSFLFFSNIGTAQSDSTSHPPHGGISAREWIAPLGIAASAALDPEIREWTLREHTHSLDQLAKSVNPLGTAQRLVPAMAITYAAAVLTHHESLANGTLNTAAAYIASDLAESVLKPVIGRERPHVEGNSHRVHPFTTNGDWHSLPSAHVTHITAIAEAIAMQTHSTPLTALGSGLVALVSWDRVYEDQHWTSDVTATIAITSLITSATVRWLESRRERH